MSTTVDECLFSVVATHGGYRRQRNEDAVLARDRYGLWAVADGMGGHERGDEASQAVVSRLGDAVADRFLGAKAVVEPALQEVNAELYARGAAIGQGTIVGSTAVALVLEGADFHCFWVGDSRAYLLRDGGLQRITEDHSDYQDGASSVTLTRALGAQPEVTVDHVSGALYEDDVFLLCSDGLTGVVDEARITATLHGTDPASVGERLVAEALAAGGPDNISAVAVFVRGGSG